MDINQSSLDILFRGVRLDYQSLYDSTPSWADQIATTIPSGDVRSVTYGWMDRLPIFREWLGNRVVNAASTHARQVVNKPFELTVALDRFDVEDDQFGLFKFTVQSMGMQAKKWPDHQIARWMRSDASTVNGFDGVPQFSTAHPLLGGDVVGSSAGGFGGITGVPATQSNLLLSTALTYDNYVAARATMRSYLGADGQPLDIEPNVLVVPPQLEQIGKLILEAENVPSTTATSGAAGQAAMTNTYRNTAKLMVIPELANKSTNWWLLDTTKVVKPFLWQLRSAPQVIPRFSMTDPAVFDLHQFLYGADARGNAAETVWFLALAGTSAASY